MSSQPPTNQPVTGWQRSLVIGLDRGIYWLARHWVGFFSLIAAIYVGLPILAPVLMKAGVTAPARAIYTVYSPLCHQMASRSFFLFGDQAAYPRAIAGSSLTPIEAYMVNLPEFAGASTDPAQWTTFLMAARRFVGNEQMGYKMALCERDIAIYGFVFLASIGYGLLRRRYEIKPMPIWLFFVLGMGPIALDGFTQLFSQYATALPSLSILSRIFPLRESTPLFRTLTGAIFGFSLVWLTYPHIDKGMRDTERDLAVKLRRVGALPPEKHPE